MAGGHSRLKKVRFYAKVTVLYLITLAFIGYVIYPVPSLANSHRVSYLSKAAQKPHRPQAPKVISGLPVRIVIPSAPIDLPVDPGYYDSSDGSWTLSGYHAQFAMISTLANNVSGDTFIYGHNNNYVFGRLRHVTPSSGAVALIYTDNGHIFSYSFEKAVSVQPDDTSALRYYGPSRLTIQTCTGSINEWRTMFVFKFDKVIQ